MGSQVWPVCLRCLRAGATVRNRLPHTASATHQVTQISPRRHQSTISEKPYLPRIAQPSLWQSFVPKAFKSSPQPKAQPAKRSNPANYFIWIYLFIGSQAIRILTLKNESAQHNRMADIKLRQLREVIERLENGEDVDVEKMLGTGNEAAEQEWEQALRELESEERLWQNNRSRRRAEKHRQEARDADADPVNRIVGVDVTQDAVQPGPTPPTVPGFY